MLLLLLLSAMPYMAAVRDLIIDNFSMGAAW